jgi:hypothetical protein
MTEINESNYETYLLSYIDGELTAEETAALMKFMEQHPSCKEELTLLQETKLLPEPEIHFPNRGLLHHKSERPVYLKLWKPAAAAAILFLITFSWRRFNETNRHRPSNIAVVNVSRNNSSAGEAATGKIIKKAKNQQKTNPALAFQTHQPVAEKHVSHPYANAAVPQHKQNEPSTSSSNIAIEKNNITQPVTIALLRPLQNKINMPEIHPTIQLTACNEAWKKFEIEMDSGQLSPAMAADNHNKKQVVITISGASSNPIMSMMGGLTHLLAKADQAYTRRNEYKITSVQWGK